MKNRIKQLLREGLITEKRLDYKMPLPDDIVKINSVFKKNGFDLYLVGGSIRDALVGKEPKDYDLATNATPDQVIKILKGKDFVENILETGKAFGVINVITPTDEYEIATFRKDIGKGRRPDSVEFTSIEQDVKRRDLTMNALFYDIDKRQIVDLVGGIDDINNGVVRTVGSPVERFDEDKLRKLRAIRFAARFGSKLEPEVDKALKQDNGLDGISPERIRDEFLKGVKTAKSVKFFLELLNEYELFSWIFPKFKVGNFIEERNPVILLAIILGENNPAAVKNMLNRLTYTGDEVGKIYFLQSFKGFEPEMIYNAKKSQMKSKISDDEVRTFAKLNNLDSKLVETFLKFQLSVSGNDVAKLGIKPGPEMGRKIQQMELERFKSMLK
jgi:tRNA nucleotidyltransferase/poly(A) polymerase